MIRSTWELPAFAVVVDISPALRPVTANVTRRQETCHLAASHTIRLEIRTGPSHVGSRPRHLDWITLWFRLDLYRDHSNLQKQTSRPQSPDYRRSPAWTEFTRSKSFLGIAILGRGWPPPVLYRNVRRPHERGQPTSIGEPTARIDIPRTPASRRHPPSATLRCSPGRQLYHLRTTLGHLTSNLSLLTGP